MHFCTKFVTFCSFLKLFSTKNNENEFFHQRLGCANAGRTIQHWRCMTLNSYKTWVVFS